MGLREERGREEKNLARRRRAGARRRHGQQCIKADVQLGPVDADSTSARNTPQYYFLSCRKPILEHFFGHIIGVFPQGGALRAQS